MTIPQFHRQVYGALINSQKATCSFKTVRACIAVDVSTKHGVNLPRGTTGTLAAIPWEKRVSFRSDSDEGIGMFRSEYVNIDANNLHIIHCPMLGLIRT